MLKNGPERLWLIDGAGSGNDEENHDYNDDLR